MNLIYNFYLSISETTAGSKAYDSGNVSANAKESRVSSVV